MREKIKLLITSVPWTDTESPVLAPALLKSMCINQGIDTQAIDLNQEFLAYLDKYPKEDKINLRKFFYSGSGIFNKSMMIDAIEHLVDRILSYGPTHVALSLLTYTSQIACG